MAISLFLHANLAGSLNIVEDESAYLMDAWQSNFHILPFREFGATKGPIFLYALKAWQLLTEQTVESGRLFTSLMHVVSIPLLYALTRRLTQSRAAAFFASSLWALTPVAVSLTTNVTHIPLEIVFIFTALLFATRAHPIPAAIFFFLAILTRATAVSFLPVIIAVLFFYTHSWKVFIKFCVAGAVLLTATIAIIYPLYGWPKTAFFFNADALLIADDQKQVYQAQISNFELLNQGLSPVLREGLALLILTVTLPFVWIRATTWYLRFMLASVLLLFGWQYSLAIIIAGAVLLPPKQLNAGRWKTVATVIALWIAGVAGFYYFWGREPTPFYVTEIIPALCIAAGACLSAIFQRQKVLGLLVTAVIIVSFILTYPKVLENQYRGTVALEAAREAGEKIQQLVPDGEAIFTAQPVYAFLGKRPLYKYLTHPGWYLAERAGIVPTSIRRVFFPDPDQLASDVSRDINWIVTDWRTNDVYFNEGNPAMAPMIKLLDGYQAVANIPNNVTQPIVIYKRK